MAICLPLIMMGLLIQLSSNARADEKNNIEPNPYILIVNSENPHYELTKEFVQRIYLGKEKTWPDGSRVSPFNLAFGNKAREQFGKQVLGKDHAQLKSYWVRQIFTGMNRPPKEVEDDKAMIERIKQNPDSIGYIGKESEHLIKKADGVKIVQLKSVGEKSFFGSN